MCWDGFKGRKWRDDVDVRDFIQNNYTIYDGDESFLEGPTEATNKLWGKLKELQDFKKRSELRVEFLIWRRKLFQLLEHMDRDI